MARIRTLTCQASLAVAVLVLSAGSAIARCIVPLPVEAGRQEEQEEQDRAVQSDLWRKSSAVYLAELIPADPADIEAPTGELPTTHVRVVRRLSILAPLRGIAPEERNLILTFTSNCVPSDIERGVTGDLFVIYATSASLAAAPIIAADRIIDPDTRLAINDLRDSATEPHPAPDAPPLAAMSP